MTKENVLNLYKHYSKLIENPVGGDSQERALVRSNALRAKRNLEEHFKKSNKYRDDPEVKKILGVKEEVIVVKEVKEGVKKDGKTSKR